MPDAVTPGNSASSASQQVRPGASTPLTLDPRCCTLPRSFTVMNPVTRTVPGAHTAVSSSCDVRTDTACSKISFGSLSSSRRVRASASVPRPNARVPASGCVITVPSASTLASTSGLNPVAWNPSRSNRNDRAGVFAARPRAYVATVSTG
nr:hypothetical protein [Actinomadura sp. CNU-125]